MTEQQLKIYYISTHTLTWSVTRKVFADEYWDDNFNSHAHVERDRSLPISAVVVDHFNSHAHVERDGKYLHQKDSYFISTHTLTWSVTESRSYLSGSKNNFNSHAHVERDLVV